MKKKIILTIIILIILGVIFSVGGVLYYKNYRGAEIKDKTNLIINNNNITLKLKNNVIIKDGTVYVSLPDIKNFFDKYIYLEKETNEIVTTYEKKVASIGFESKSMVVNGANKQIFATAIKENDIIYLPISEMQAVYNMELQNCEKSNIVVIDSLDREQVKSNTTKKLSVKWKKTIFSKSLDKLIKGDTVVVISKDEDGWAKVKTQNGKIGYVKTKYLTNETKVRDKWEDKKQISEKVDMYWEYFSTEKNIPDMIGKTFEGVNVVSPSFFYIDSNGIFQERIGTAGLAYIKWAKSNGYKIWPMVSNAETKIEVTSKILNNYKLRQNLIEKIVDVCVKYGLDGVNIDFENMYKEDKQVFSRFIIELQPRLKELEMITSVDVTAPDGDEKWSLCYDRNVLGDVADYLVFMAYDQHGAGSKKAGTTAGYNWIENNIKKFLSNEDVNSEKIILAIPFYTRIWTETANGDVTSKVVSMKDIESNIQKGTEKEWKDDVKQNYVEYKQGNTTKKMWIEDEKSIESKINLVNQYNLAGVSAWSRGREATNIWATIKNELQKNVVKED